jgi:hypothetical protein
MSRQPNIINERLCSHLKELVKIKSGLSCNSFSDIQLLQFQVKKITGEYISVQTLNRFFGLIKYDFHPSNVTLDIIARYLNYDSYFEFVKIYHQPLILTGMKKQTADMLITLFRGINPVYGNEISLCKLCQNVYKVIDKNENIANEMYATLARTALGRKYIFENCVYVDKLNGHYGSGIDFYLLHAKKQEEFLFVHSVFCLREFLKADYKEFEVHFNKIRDFPLDELATCSPVVIARYGAALIFNEMIGSALHQINEKAGEVIKLLTVKPEDKFEIGLGLIILAEALLLTGACEEVLRIIYDPKIKFYTRFGETENTVLSNQVNLLKLYSANNRINSSSLNINDRIKTINDSKFHFLSNDFYTILLNQLFILTGNTKEVKIAKNLLQQLIVKTGFTFFNEPVREFMFQ